jgi:hypothetical protein
MTTDDGTVALESAFELKLIVRPPVGAGPVSTTVPVTTSPPVAAVGLTATLAIAEATTERLTDLLTPFLVAVSVTDVVVATGSELTLNT